MSLEEPSLYKDNFNKLYKMFNTSLVEIRDIYIQFRLGNSNNSEYEKDLNILNNIRADIFTEQQELFKGSMKILHPRRIGRFHRLPFLGFYF